ncbi:allophanate hydrolase [Curtobacterium sp. MCJR17_055]|uniref:5-oxoprolinase subunit B family protein n=1 Tax=unclassified Curtobacterium TaxID=257496 RepID=UPI000D9C9289|nr:MULTISPECIES: allophanate hydrolase subunit 1 [unclassified Curtobacterium]PYY33310.1 allophanate hydrolase [Curtobacterium sp. MCBD17_029]PYY53254.1 allophanate hydrolase [Curtobacterium sp. MCJR17_055]PYY56408.1 allophanate hydrolase [Curtobacterium sp. MCPF17_015]
MTPDVRVAGATALLATFDTLTDVVAFRAGLTASALPGVTEVVSGARTLLLRFDPTATDAGRLRALLSDVEPVRPSDDRADRDPVVVPVTYDGADLDAVGALTGMTRGELVAWHTGQVWTSAFCGFAPGFSYLTGTAPSLDLPRRDTSRTAVPSGAVALAGEFSAVYPRTSPGGWQLIGRTEVPMWSLDRTPPALAPAGVRLRFVDAAARS